MNIERWEPFSEMISLRDSFNRLLDEAFVRPGIEFFPGLRGAPALDMYETDDAIKVEMPMPGVKPAELVVEITNHTLAVKGERKHEEDIKEERYYRHEVQHGIFTRTLSLPESADVGKVEAQLKDGMLTITFPKTAVAQPKRIEIKQ